MVGTKRRRDDDDTDDGTPRKLRARIADEAPDEQDLFEAQTPSRRGRTLQLAEDGTPRSILKKSRLADAVHDTPRSSRKLVFETPTKSGKDETPNGTPAIVRNADRSARRKSNRRMLERTLNGADSDDEALEEDEILAEQILGEEEDEVADHAQEEAAQEDNVPVPETPSKRGRGRPKGSGKGGRPVGRPRKERQRSPTPPTELPPHEIYFWQNRPAGTKTSNNTLSAQTLLNHDEFFQTIQTYQDPHEPERDFLLELHGRAYDQWIFELDEGFNICLYGYGSKRTVTERFTACLYHHLLERFPYKGTKKIPKIVVVNGYTAGTVVKDILTTIASTVVPANLKMPNQLATLLDFVLEHLSNHPPSHPIHVVINSIDSPYLRKTPTPSMLARLASHPNINLICTADTPNFPLLWDVGLKTQYKFLFHDTTTFAPYDAEIDTVETVNELLGRSGRRVGGRDGVGFVLRSLPENARELFRILVMEQLALSLVEGALGEDEDVPATSSSKKVPQTKNTPSESSQGVEYRVLYHKAVEAFVCSSEVGFRTLLKEFHDHQMIESRKDAMGTERLWVPFRQDELEGLAEDLAAEAF
ncbi:Origin recognition complex subunit 2 [Neocucurbitaria cava]|uniref:Origin recognition complex subunit 2 n=1 Tax=Neocucurbitaria cava TaxID=798079 RepID=A0A9W8Y459_9PLEO|nr:Origin recognition complex subunit 2 [Neocucurbitaria cava]